ncbi:alpha/beta hydrolase [Micromonospora inyonensis]|uniref:Arylformamidase n=1 Tax=Micromonospora inyonensis TaxID=47866 RepID=A0A1C6SD82_9ACTN|nr:alpha/beta hydrolase [Micromonospora inyonensis]SCL27433.1 arylformamidase [Micromonospora inyonensis]
MSIVNSTPFVRRVGDSVAFGVTVDISHAEPDDALEMIFRCLQDAIVDASVGDIEFVDADLRYPAKRVPDAAHVERMWRQHFAGNIPLLRVEPSGDGSGGVAELTGRGSVGESRSVREPIFAGFDENELGWQYSPILWESGVPDILASWRRRGLEHLASHDVRADLRYGADKNAVLDLYLPRTPEPRPLAIFLHGGYFQMMDKADHGHFTKGILDSGYAVAVLNYSLCPDVGLSDIVTQVDEACSWLYANAHDLGYRSRGAVAIGHSAGAHLAAMMCAGVRGKPEEEFLSGFLGVSGLYDLTPLLLMPVASTLGLQRANGFRGLSPMFLVPPANLRAVVAVGAQESSEFHLQTEQLRTQWAAHVGEVTSLHVPDVAHFGVMEHLVEGVLLDAALDLLGQE